MTSQSARLELDQFYRLAGLAKRGAPFGEIGRVEHRRRRAIAPDPTPTPLVLASGLLDDERQVMENGDLLYGLFAYAKQWQDIWSDRQHGSFWVGALQLWPASRGRDGNTYALAYALTYAVQSRVDLDDFVEALSADLRTKAIKGLTAKRYTLATLQRRGVIRIATEMIMAPQHFYPDTGRLPRVITERERMPHPPLDDSVLDRFSKRGDASREIVTAARRVASELPEISPAVNS